MAADHREGYLNDGPLDCAEEQGCGGVDLTDEEAKEFDELVAPLLGSEIMKAIDDECGDTAFC